MESSPTGFRQRDDRSPDGAQAKSGTVAPRVETVPGYAALHPGYGRTLRSFTRVAVTGSLGIASARFDQRSVSLVFQPYTREAPRPHGAQQVDQLLRRFGIADALGPDVGDAI